MLLASPILALPDWVVHSPDYKTPGLLESWQSSLLALGWQLLLLTPWCPEVVPQLWVNYSLHSSSPLCWAVLIFIGTKDAMHLLFFSTCHFKYPPLQNKTKLFFFFPLKNVRAVKTLGRCGMAESDMFGAGLDPFFPMGYNKGFILNPDTVQYSFWSEVGRGASTSRYENSSVHSAWKAATLGKFQSHVSPCWKAVKSQHRTTGQKCHVGQFCFEAVSEEASSLG